MVHALKIYPEYYEAVKSGKKPFEVRKNDRDFKVGDILALNEFDPLEGEKGQYTGRATFQRISYILADETSFGRRYRTYECGGGSDCKL